ncbi:hypothetical protein [Halorubrum sp. BV1]|uniref:hypothetical protein n=1 Tax=Halorubrum sp. BV1 TaxID=1498500 RepID=UPI000679BEB6|nr:hypothetical protein [Halorubrum sp. BV1]
MSPTAQALARTYSDREYSDPWQKVLDYCRVREYAAEHPDHGRTRVGNALDLPPSRVRGWLDGGMPDPVRGIQTAIDHGWLDPDETTTAAFVDLLAHVLAGGSINDTFVPAITVDDSVTTDEVRAVFEALGVDVLTRNAEVDNRATEVVPAADASVLGRCLVAIGAPVGKKVGLDSFPQIVWDAPKPVRESFARIYVSHRALTYETKDTRVIQEDRSRAYLCDLRDVVAEVTGEPVSVGDGRVTVSAAAARRLAKPDRTGSVPSSSPPK